MAIEVKWTLYSLEDIDRIAEFISKDSIFYAQVQTERFFQRVKMLETYPKAGRVVEEIGAEDIRELVEGNYRIIYRIISDYRIEVLTVHSSSQLLANNPFQG